MCTAHSISREFESTSAMARSFPDRLQPRAAVILSGRDSRLLARRHMKPTIAIPGVLWFLSACITCVSAGELKIGLKIEGELAAEILLKIEGDIATAKVADETEQF